MGAKSKIETWLGSGSILKWAVGISIKLLVETAIPAVVATFVSALIAPIVVFFPALQEIIPVLIGSTTGTDVTFDAFATVALVWISLFGFYLTGIRCNFP